MAGIGMLSPLLCAGAVATAAAFGPVPHARLAASSFAGARTRTRTRTGAAGLAAPPPPPPPSSAFSAFATGGGGGGGGGSAGSSGFGTYDPLGLGVDWDDPMVLDRAIAGPAGGSRSRGLGVNPLPLAALSASGLLLAPGGASADDVMSRGDFNPDTFRPICGASDGFYRFLQGTTRAVVGEDSFVEYAPLIAGGLLRIRLELCVVESFFNEAVGPFIRQNGISWILPLHETVETFIAGTVFALATTFILVGSTKLISVIALYGDVFVGAPARLFGGFCYDRARGKPVTLDVGFGRFKKRLVGPPASEGEDGEARSKEFGELNPAEVPVVIVSGAVKYAGEALGVVREGVEALDLFVGRYLVVLATGYILFKFVHFKVFPDFP